MPTIVTPPPDSLPPTSRLHRSALVAVVVAGFLVVAAVLPAERGIDPTGIGRLIGLKEVGDTKVALLAEAVADSIAEAEGRAADSLAALAKARQEAAANPGQRADTTTVGLQPGGTYEIKLVMRKGARVNFAWSTDGGGVNHDTHGDTANARPGDFHSYSRGTSKTSDEGQIVAVFDGLHGWFWRNRGSRPVVITLRTSGEYAEVRRMK
jgi:hypothetical protein